MSYAVELLLPALVVLLLFCLLVQPLFVELLPAGVPGRACQVLLGATLVSFLSLRVQVLMPLLALTALWARARLGGGVRGALGAMAILGPTSLPLHWEVGGLGAINYLFDFNALRVLEIVLLTDVALRRLGSAEGRPPRAVRWIDRGLLGYLALRLALLAPHYSGTALLRGALESTVDVLLPYYALSRGLRSRDDVRFVLSGLLLGLGFAAAVGVAEGLARHSVYSDLQWVYGVRWSLTKTLMRGHLLRSTAMSSEPIILAFEMIFALAVWSALRPELGGGWRPKVLVALLLACLASTGSRGPWLGAGVFFAVLAAVERLPVRVAATGLVLAAAGAVAAVMSGADEAVLRLLDAAFGFDADGLGSILYRKELLDTALALLRQSPWFGVPDYAAQMQTLRQGEGIIDLVNTYVGIGLDAGVMGLTLYLFPYAIALTALIAGLRRRERADVGTVESFSPNRLPGVLVALTAAVLFTIFTTSTYSVMVFLLSWLLALASAQLAGAVDTEGPTASTAKEGGALTAAVRAWGPV